MNQPPPMLEPVVREPSEAPAPPAPVPSIRVGGDGAISLAPGTSIVAEAPHPSFAVALASRVDALVAIGGFLWWGARGTVDPQTAGALVLMVLVAMRRGGVGRVGGGLVGALVGARRRR